MRAAAGSLNHLRLSVRDPVVSAALYGPVLVELGWAEIASSSSRLDVITATLQRVRTDADGVEP